MFGGRGFPGGFFGMDRDGEEEDNEPKDVDTETLYKILGVPSSTKDTNEIKKAYRK
jgi:DnaJ-class molecular chaperone